ncbi:endolytic transglycosylase MltG [Amycolatopsis suaedae]|uniref:Endolytic murein transglycosylase n=1 Tax=Amycolatopsis suaedae TaxID=2510978 RepID=A0A4Q7JEU7_9PSEU|nr:endolytic transglycosylase MltG [Amycolatopsis suaedae]
MRRPAPPRARPPRRAEPPRPSGRRHLEEEPPTEVIDSPPPPPPRPRSRRAEPEPEPVPEDDYYDDLLEDEYYDDEYYDDEYEDEPPPRKRRRGRRVLGWVAALAVIGLLAAGAFYGAQEFLGFGYDDYEGSGEADIVVQVAEGNSTNAIGAKLQEAGVVASAKAFVEASEDDDRVRSVQPGYYVLKTKMSGASAVARLVDPAARKGVLQIRGGTQLDDIIQPDKKVTDGVYALLSKASCADLNGQSTCVPPDALRQAAGTADLTAFGVPPWAAEQAAKAEPARRIEGLVAPGVYDVKPGWNAQELLGAVLKESATRLQATGLPKAADGTGRTPYQILTIASIIEREGVKTDFGKVSRVIFNRLGKDMKLEMDSTINYVLHRPVVTTTPEDRAKAGPYNTYLNKGLPPTPISAPSEEAVEAALKPAEGEWLFFVKCEKNGLSCFAVTNDEHEQNKRDARARGAY